MLTRKASLIAAGACLVAAAVAFAITRLHAHRAHPPVAGGTTLARANPDVSTGSSIGDAPAPPFTLRDQNGRITSLSDFRGKVVVLAFVDAHCTTVCPLMTESMVEAIHLLGPAASKVQLLGIDANPLATRVADVAAYTRAHHMQGRWRFLTGSLSELKKVWHAYHVYVAAIHNDIDHQPIIVLIDPQGRERRIYATQMSFEGVLQQAELLAQGISGLLANHPAVRDAVSLRHIPPLKPTSEVRLSAIGGGTTVLLGKQHPHLLLFFAAWLSENADLAVKMTALDQYATAARQHGWPLPAAIDELPTESKGGAAQRTLSALAASLRTPIVEDAQGRLGDGYGVQDLPWFVLTSPSGRILWHHDGWLPSQTLSAEVRAVLSRHRSDEP